MNAPSTPTIADSIRPGTSGKRLHGRWLVVARVTWVVVVGLVVTLFIASFPTYFAFLHTTTTGIVVDLNAGQLNQDGVQALHALGLSVDFYAIYHLVLNALFTLASLTIGGLLYWRKADDRMALFTSFALVIFPIISLYQITTLSSSWWVLVQLLNFLGTISFALFFYLFPSGRFVPCWSRWLMVGWVIYGGISAFFFIPSFYFIANVLFFALLISLIHAQVYRYRRTSTLLERQQTKWVVFGITVAIAGLLSVIIPGTFFPSFFPPGTFLYLILNTVLNLFLLCIPLSIGVAILRSRLWDIDIVINRSLVYGTLTFSLALTYAGSVLALQALLRSFIGGSEVALVGSTLLIAVLFQPLRRRIQAIIDRRFFRRKYDSSKVLEAFSTTLQSEVDLNDLCEQLVAVIEETMQPAHISLWLRTTNQEKGGRERLWVISAGKKYPALSG
jgi:hypothetical protein